MRYILIILVFLSVGAKAQMVIKAHANYRPFVAPISGNLLLDDYPNAAAAYSLRKLDKDYIGNCIRVRRDSVGQTEQDFGFTASGYLDTTAIKNFCRANAGKIVTWYDQSGNGRNISQSTASRQPNFWTGSGFGSLTATLNDVRKSLAFEDIGQMRLINNFSTISQPITTFSVSRIDNSTTGGFEMIYDSYNNTTFALGYTGTTESPNNRWLISSGTGLVGTTAGNTSPNIYTALHNSTSSSIHINGQSYASGNSGTNGLDGISVGNLRGNPNPLFTGYGLDGRIAELIIYGSNQSTNRTAIESNINNYYAITTNNLLLDDYPNAAAAYSLRKLDKDYTGACMRIRRIDNSQETDIGFVNNYLDTTAIKNFTGSGTSAVVVSWYDQSGNGRTATQSVAANQPTIMINNFEFALMGPGLPNQKGIFFVTGDQRLVSNFTTISQPISAFAYVRKDNTTTAAAGVVYDSYNNTGSAFYYTGTTETTNNRWSLASGIGLRGTTQGNTNPNLFSTLHNGASSSIHINGQSYVSGNAGTNGLDGISIGNLRGNPSPLVSGYVLDGRVGELIIYGSNQSTNRTAIENNINDYYNIYWNGDFTGILDTYPNSAAAYSLRNLSSTYKGPLIRVRKDTTGQPEIDVYGDYYGNLDTVGLKNFLLTRDGRVVRFYDQSGNGRDATQSTASNQPVIAVNGVINRNPVNNRVSVNFTYDRNHLLQTSNQTFSGNITMFGAYNMYTTPDLITEFAYGIFSYGEESNARRRSLIIWNGGSGSTWYHYGSAFAQNLQIAQATAPTNSLVYSLFNHTSQQISGGYNGGTAVTASRTLTNPAASPIYIGATGSGERLDGNIFELIMYNSNQSSNRTGIESNINSYYSIY